MPTPPSAFPFIKDPYDSPRSSGPSSAFQSSALLANFQPEARSDPPRLRSPALIGVVRRFVGRSSWPTCEAGRALRRRPAASWTRPPARRRRIRISHPFMHGYLSWSTPRNASERRATGGTVLAAGSGRRRRRRSPGPPGRPKAAGACCCCEPRPRPLPCAPLPHTHPPSLLDSTLQLASALGQPSTSVSRHLHCQRSSARAARLIPDLLRPPLPRAACASRPRHVEGHLPTDNLSPQSSRAIQRWSDHPSTPERLRRRNGPSLAGATRSRERGLPSSCRPA